MEWPRNLALYAPHLHARLRRGMGMGMAERYVPWANVRELFSAPTASNPVGIKVQRQIHLRDDLEQTYFHLLERDPHVLDIRERWPILDIASTLQICGQFGATHPTRKKLPEPFTLFLVTRETKDGIRYEAHHVCSVQHAQNELARRRLHVEKEWAERHSISWVLVDTSDFNKEVLDSLTFIRGWFRHRYVADKKFAPIFAQEFLSVHRLDRTLKELIILAARLTGQPFEQADNAFRYCAWNSLIDVDIRQRIRLDQPLTLRQHHG